MMADQLHKIHFCFSTETYNQFSNVALSSINQHAPLKPLSHLQKRLKTKQWITTETYIYMRK